jgi:hypothetical protein
VENTVTWFQVYGIGEGKEVPRDFDLSAGLTLMVKEVKAIPVTGL